MFTFHSYKISAEYLFKDCHGLHHSSKIFFFNLYTPFPFLPFKILLTHYITQKFLHSFCLYCWITFVMKSHATPQQMVMFEKIMISFPCMYLSMRYEFNLWSILEETAQKDKFMFRIVSSHCSPDESFSIHRSLRQLIWYRSGTVNSKSFVGKVLLRIKWKFKLN